MSVSSLFHSSHFARQLMRSATTSLISVTSSHASQIACRILDCNKEKSFSTSSLNSLASLSTRECNLRSMSHLSVSIGSLSSWISNGENVEETAEEEKSQTFLSLKRSSLVNGIQLSPELLDKIEEHKETGHKYLLLSESSKFIFFEKGNLSQMICYSVYRANTGEYIKLERDLRDMVCCFCYMKEDLDKGWIETSSQLAKTFRINKKQLKYSFLLIRFDEKSVFACSNLSQSLKRISQLQGTQLNLSKNVQEKLQTILEKRMNNKDKKYN